MIDKIMQVCDKIRTLKTKRFRNFCVTEVSQNLKKKSHPESPTLINKSARSECKV